MNNAIKSKLAITFLALSTSVFLGLTAYYISVGNTDDSPLGKIVYESSLYGGRGKGSLFSRPMAVASGKEGRLYVTDTDNHRVMIFDRDGSMIARFPREKEKVRIAVPLYIAINSKQEIFISDRGTGRILVFSQDGKMIKTVTPNGNDKFLWGPNGMAFDEKDNLYVTDLAYHRIVVLDRHFKVVRTFGKEGTQPGQFSFANGIAYRNGRLYVADSNNGRVQVFDTKGKLVFSFLSGSLPRGIALDDHRIYVSDALEHVVRSYNPANGSDGMTLGRYGQGVAEFAFPNGLALGEERLYVADRENNRIQTWKLVE